MDALNVQNKNEKSANNPLLLALTNDTILMNAPLTPKMHQNHRNGAKFAPRHFGIKNCVIIQIECS